jgi:hypothetical protein
MLAAPDLRAEHPARPAKSVEADHIFALRSAQADRGAGRASASLPSLLIIGGAVVLQ